MFPTLTAPQLGAFMETLDINYNTFKVMVPNLWNHHPNVFNKGSIILTINKGSIILTRVCFEAREWTNVF